jgi:TRAP-type uncharacterized transport system substrate-binding protein
MWRSFWRRWIAAIISTAIVVAVLYIAYRWVDPLPPRQFAIAAGAAGSGYESIARQYARILARDGIALKIRNGAGALENVEFLRDSASGVQAALTAFGFTQPHDPDILYSLGGIFDGAIFICYRTDELITQFSQFRGKRLSIGMPGTALRALMLQVLKATDALDSSTHFVDLDSAGAVEALRAGDVDVAIFPQETGWSLLQRALSHHWRSIDECRTGRSNRQNGSRFKARDAVARTCRFDSRHSKYGH